MEYLKKFYSMILNDSISSIKIPKKTINKTSYKKQLLD